MSSRPWMVFGATIYQLNDAENENVWSAHVQGARLPLDDACAIAKKMHAAEDMHAALKAVSEMQAANYGYGMETHMKLAGLMPQVRAALAKAAP